MEERLQKLLSAAGLCSRRQAEAYLRAGRSLSTAFPPLWGTGRTRTGTGWPWTAARWRFPGKGSM